MDLFRFRLVFSQPHQRAGLKRLNNNNCKFISKLIINKANMLCTIILLYVNSKFIRQSKLLKQSEYAWKSVTLMLAGSYTCHPCYFFHRSNTRTQTCLHQTTPTALPTMIKSANLFVIQRIRLKQDFILSFMSF